MPNDDDDELRVGRYDIGAHDSTRAGIRAMRKQVNSVAEEHAADRALLTRMIRWVIGLMGTAIIGGFIPLISTLIGIGEVREQQRSMRTEVTEVLKLSQQLDHDQAELRANTNSATQNIATVRGQVLVLETKVWEATQRQRLRENP